MVKNLPFKQKLGVFYFFILLAFIINATQAVFSYNINKSAWYQEHATRKTTTLIYQIQQMTDRTNYKVENFLRTKNFQMGEKVVVLMGEIFEQLQELHQQHVISASASSEHVKEHLVEQLERFNQIMERYQAIGLNENSGEHGRIRAGIHQIETLLTLRNQFQLLTSMLQLRRHEKDFMDRKDQLYLAQFNQEAERFKVLIKAEKSFSTQEMEETLSLFIQYSKGFHEIARDILEVTQLIEAFRNGIGEVDEAMQELMLVLVEVFNKHDVKQKSLLFDQFINSQVTFLFILLIISMLLSWFQYDIYNAIEELSAIACKVASGEDQEIDVVRRDEIGGLARSLKSMKSSLSSRHLEVVAKVVELEESEKKYATVIQLAGDPIISLNEDLEIFAWNQGAQNCFGYREEVIKGRLFTGLVALRNQPALTMTIHAIKQDGKSRMLGANGDFLCLRAQGALFPAMLSLSAWEMDQKLYFTIILQDISERIAKQREIERALDLRLAISEILQQSLQPLTLKEILNRALEILLSVPWLRVEQRGAIFLYESTTETLELVVHKSLAPELIVLCQTVSMGHCLCGRAAASGEVVMSDRVDDRHETRFEGMTPHGHYCVPIVSGQQRLGLLNVYVSAGHLFQDEEVVFLKNIANTLAGLIVRHQAEHKIMQLSRALEQSPVAIIIADVKGQIEYVNPRFSILTEYDPAEVFGDDLLALKMGSDTSEQQKLKQLMGLGGEWSGELHSYKKGGELYWEYISFSPVLGVDGQVINYIVISEDITETKELEAARDQLLATLDAKVVERTLELKQKIQELESTRSELIESEKMASLGRLVAGIAHEVNTPIGVAYSASTQMQEESVTIAAMLQQEEVDVDELMLSVSIVSEASSLVVRNLQRAAELIQSFKRASIDHASEAERAYLVAEVIRDVQMSLSNQFKKCSIVIDAICPEALQVVGVPGYLTQILTNLMLNSLTHGFAGGRLPGTISMRFFIDGNLLNFQYLDSGQGMSNEAKQRAFEPFFTTNRSDGGSGLGLYICYNLITTKLKGTVSLVSAPGEGVQFNCRWPVVVKI